MTWQAGLYLNGEMLHERSGGFSFEVVDIEVLQYTFMIEYFMMQLVIVGTGN